MTAPNGYHLIFSDDFDTLDLSRWTPTSPTMFSGYGAETWDPARVGVSGGLATLSATADLHAGELRSRATFAPPAYFECRMKLPATPGFWPGFWLASDYSNTAAQSRQEIDIAECDSAVPSRIGENLHWGVASAPTASNGGYVDPSLNFQTDFHTYGVWYAADRIEFYVDEQVTRLFLQPLPPVITDPMQPRLSLSIFGTGQTWATPPGPTTVWPGQLVVDWVRVWQPGSLPPPDTTAPSLTLVSPLNGLVVGRKTRVTITALITDNDQVAGADLYVNGVFFSTRLAGPWTWDFSTSGKPNTAYTFKVVAHDRTGNSAQASSTVTVR